MSTFAKFIEVEAPQCLSMLDSMIERCDGYTVLHPAVAEFILENPDMFAHHEIEWVREMLGYSRQYYETADELLHWVTIGYVCRQWAESEIIRVADLVDGYEALVRLCLLED